MAKTNPNKLEAELNYVVGHEAQLLARVQSGVELQEEDYALLRHYEARRRKLYELKQHTINGVRVVRPYAKASLFRIREANDGGVVG
jgi:hypothetical protein